MRYKYDVSTLFQQNLKTAFKGNSNTSFPNKMKTFVYICVLVFVSFSSAALTWENFSDNSISCLTKLNISMVDAISLFTMQDILNDTYKLPENVPRQRINGCLYQCLLQQRDMMDESDFKMETIRNILHTQGVETDTEERIKLHSALDNCANEANTVTEKCQKTFDFVACFSKHIERKQ